MKLYQHLSHGFYFVTDTEARKLARGANAKLPSSGREVRVEVARGVLGWLARTPTKASVQGGPKRGWVWSISRFSDEKFVPISVMAQSSREALIAEADQLVERLEALGHRQAPNYRGVMVRVIGSKFHRPPPAPATAASEDLSTAALREWVQNFRLDAHVASEVAAKRAARHESGKNPLTLGERAKMRLGVLSPTASRAAASREKELLRRQVSDVRQLSESLEACRRCEPGAEKKARKVLVRARETLKGLEKLAHYRHEGDVAEAVMRPLRNQIAAAEALVTGEKAVVEVRGVAARGNGKASGSGSGSGKRVVEVEGVPSAEWHEAGGNPSVSRFEYPREPKRSYQIRKTIYRDRSGFSIIGMGGAQGVSIFVRTREGAEEFREMLRARDAGKITHEESREKERDIFARDTARADAREVEAGGAKKHEAGSNPRVSRALPCKLHKGAHPYRVCSKCGKQFCPHYWDSCPRCVPGQTPHAEVVPPSAHVTSLRPYPYPDARERAVAALHGEETRPYPYPDEREAGVARLYGRKAQGGGWPGRMKKHEGGKNPRVVSHSRGKGRKKVRPEPERLVVGGTLGSRIARLLGKK